MKTVVEEEERRRRDTSGENGAIMSIFLPEQKTENIHYSYLGVFILVQIICAYLMR